MMLFHHLAAFDWEHGLAGLSWLLTFCQFASFAGPGDEIGPVTITSTYQDAFNSSSSYVKSLADSGNVNFSLGGGNSSADVVTNLVPLLAFVFAALGGLWLVTRD